MRAPGSPLSAKAMASTTVASRAVRRAEDATTRGKRSVKMRLGQRGSAQRQRRVCSRNRTASPCQGKSTGVRQ